MPRVIICESVQLALFVIAVTRRSRANITLTTNSAAMTVLRALVMGRGNTSRPLRRAPPHVTQAGLTLKPIHIYIKLFH